VVLGQPPRGLSVSFQGWNHRGLPRTSLGESALRDRCLDEITGVEVMSVRDRLGLRGKTAGEGFAFNAWCIAKYGARPALVGYSFTPVAAMIAWQEGRR